LPLDLGVLLDFSDSQAEFLRSHQKDLQNFLKQSLAPLDRSFLVCFGNHVLLVRDFTREPRSIIDALNRFESRGNMFNVGTAFYDAIYYSVEKRLTVTAGTRRALVIFSDGEDSVSTHDLAQTIRAAQLKDVLVFAIRYTEVPKGGLRVYNREGI
jgi:Ca-activated chloride channel homolog